MKTPTQEFETVQPEYMTKPKTQLNPSEFLKAWRAGRFSEGEEVRLKVSNKPARKGKISDETIRAIRESEEKPADLAKKYSLSNAMIYNIKKKRVYKDVK